MILLTVLALSSCSHFGKGCKTKCSDKKQCELKKKKHCSKKKKCADKGKCCKEKKCKDKGQCDLKKAKAKADHKAADCTNGQCQLHKKD